MAEGTTSKEVAAGSVKSKIQEATKDAMRAQDKPRLAVLRLVQAAIKQKEVDERIELADDQTLSILEKMIRQRKDSIEQFQKGNRQDLVEKETFEISVIETFLPPQLDIQQIKEMVTKAIQDTNAQSIKDMGKVMGVLKSKLAGQADMTLVSTLIKEQLSK